MANRANTTTIDGAFCESSRLQYANQACTALGGSVEISSNFIPHLYSRSCRQGSTVPFQLLLMAEISRWTPSILINDHGSAYYGVIPVSQITFPVVQSNTTPESMDTTSILTTGRERLESSFLVIVCTPSRSTCYSYSSSE